ncbi:MAG TPA: RNA ligase family protein, partial [Kofleriaceae bacterium]
MRFRTYPKIGGTAESTGGTWVATEKIHGANFVVGVTGDELWFGKRKAWLAPDDAFFGWQLLARELADPVRALARSAGAAQLVCFGEVFGGAYPHPEIAAIPGLSAVQTGIWYTPEVRWSVFDLLVAADDTDDGELLAHGDVEELAAAAGLLTPPVLGRGRLADLDR